VALRVEVKAVVLDDLIAIDVPQTEGNTPMHAKISCCCHLAIGQAIDDHPLVQQPN
jgi:hypothetical protein